MAHVLILGATSTIATAVARRYASRGDRLFLVGRDPDKLAAVVDALGGRSVESLAADFTDFAGNEAVVDAAFNALGTVDVVLVAHGWLGDQLASEQRFEEAHAVIDANFTSVVSLLVPLANRLEAQGRGHLAVITSVAAERGRPRNFTYGAAKAGVNTYLQGLRSRLWRSGVQVHILKPGPVDTPMTTDHAKNVFFATPDQVADGIVRAIDAGRHVAWLPGFWALIMPVVRAMPEPIFQRLPFLSGR